MSNKKSETFRKLAAAVFSLEASKGHLAWKVTDLVRKSGFSRALVYRYLGGSKSEMLKTVVKNFVTEFYGFESTAKSLAFPDRVRQARQKLVDFPELTLFYIKWRGRSSDLQAEFIEVEKRYQRRLKRMFPSLSDHEILIRHTVLHGLVTAPFLSPDQAAEIYAELFESS